MGREGLRRVRRVAQVRTEEWGEAAGLERSWKADFPCAFCSGMRTLRPSEVASSAKGGPRPREWEAGSPTRPLVQVALARRSAVQLADLRELSFPMKCVCLFQ